MYFTDLGRKKEIGAHCAFIKIGSFHILVDCGMDPGTVGKESLPQLHYLDSIPLDLIIITHCHLDHIGALPVLMRRQPQARILLSIPSQSLLFPMLENSHHVMKRQREELEIKEYPLYSKEEIESLREHLCSMPLATTRIFQNQNEEIEITFVAAGHIPGAASVMLKHKHRKIFFSGDVLFRDQYILKGARWSKAHVDTLVMETTRGISQRPKDQTARTETTRLIEAINATLRQNGSVLIPSFALGRMQEILMILHDARIKKQIPPNTPILASGLGLSLTEPLDQLSAKNRELIFKQHIIDDLKVQSIQQSPYLKPGQSPSKPSIFVVSSGMMSENTPSYNVAAALLEHPQHGIFFVGFCADDTPGKKLLDTHPGELFSFDALRYKAPVQARIEHFDLSGHADREELLQMALQIDPRIIILDHGDGEARQWFVDSFTELAPRIQILNPEVGIEYSI
jgi:Cft2 family RNA processing exonuclease